MKPMDDMRPHSTQTTKLLCIEKQELLKATSGPKNMNRGRRHAALETTMWLAIALCEDTASGAQNLPQFTLRIRPAVG